MTKVYLIRVTTYSCDIYSEEYIVTNSVFGSREDAETYILEKNLLDEGQCDIVESNLKGKLCLNL